MQHGSTGSPLSRGRTGESRAKSVLAIVALLIALLAPTASFAVRPDEMLKDPVLEARARHLSEELRCMVCQNQSIDDSEAPLAHDLRVLVRQRLEAGDSDRQVLDFLVSRYGDFVLLKPPFKAETLLLWGLPPLALLAGLGALILMAKRRKAVAPEPAALSREEQAKLATLVQSGRSDG
jgi:cytochrome c-type biogenesis protein CcmH